MLESTGGIFNRRAGRAATREEIASHLMQHLEVNLGGHEDYRTLELGSNGSGIAEKVLALIQKYREEGFPGLLID